LLSGAGKGGESEAAQPAGNRRIIHLVGRAGDHGANGQGSSAGEMTVQNELRLAELERQLADAQVRIRG